MLASMPAAFAPAIAPVTPDEEAQANERALVRAAANGDRDAFAVLYRRHAPRVLGTIARLVGRGARAEDLTQEAFIRAWQSLGAWRGESAFGTWLHRLAVNTALMDLRAARARPDRDGDDDALETLGTPDTASRGGATLDLERAVAMLPPRARAVLVLFDIEGWTHDAIGDALGMAVGSSKAQLHRARGLLRTRLEAYA